MYDIECLQEPRLKRRISRGPSGLIRALAESLIRKNELSDQEMCDFIKTRYPEASTSVKCIQYYRFQMRSVGKLPQLPNSRRKEKNILMYELIPINNEYRHLQLEGTYTGRCLIKKCRDLIIDYGYSKMQAKEVLYSVPVCTSFLHRIGWEGIEFETTV
jgi:hypothetical protein